MQNIDEHSRETTENDISAYDEVVTESGIHNEAIYDESFPSSTHSNLSGKFGKNSSELITLSKSRLLLIQCYYRRKPKLN